MGAVEKFAFGLLMRQARNGYPEEGVRGLLERYAAKGYLTPEQYAKVAGALAERDSPDWQPGDEVQGNGEFTDALGEVLAGDRNVAETLRLIAESVAEDERPAEKEGFRLVKHYSHSLNRIYYTFEEIPGWKPEADGTYLRPFVWEGPRLVHEGEWWTDGEDVWEALEDGVAEEFGMPWFDVIGG